MLLVHLPPARVLTLLLSLTISSIAKSDFLDQFIDPLDGQFDASEYLAENAFGFLPVPVVITEPAVDSGLGMIGLFFHEDEQSAAKRKAAMKTSDDAAAHLLPPSVSAGYAAYTGNDSWMVGAGHMGFYKEGRLRYMVGGGHGDINLDYYNIGGIDLPRSLSIKTKASGLMQSLKIKVADLPLFIGASQRYINAELSPASDLTNLLPAATPPPLVDTITDLLTKDVVTSGVGLVVQFDTRDNVFSPKSGYNYDLSHVFYRDEIGSDIDYESTTISGLNYFELSSRWRLAVRLFGETVNSDQPLPPFAKPSIQLRGIPAARYQGSDVAVLETEVTWVVNNRWNILGFSGAGRAAASTSGIGSASSQVSRGLGFRYQVARRYGFNVGLDVAQGPEDTVVYIQAGSAW